MVWEENPEEFATELCGECGKNRQNAYLDYLLKYVALQDAGCPIGRHELTDEDWINLGRIKAKREEIRQENGKANAKFSQQAGSAR